jgi:hypothetical protein
VRTLRAADFAEIADTIEVGGFVDKLEHLVAELECKLLETLTPAQFAVVQDLMQASQIMTEARSTLDAPAAAPMERSVRRDRCGLRRAAHRRPSPRRRSTSRPTEA